MTNNFIQFLRQAAPYIASYRKKLFVLVLPNLSELKNPIDFNAISADIALLNQLGIKIILVINNVKIINTLKPINQNQFNIYQKEIEQAISLWQKHFSNHKIKLNPIEVDTTAFGIFNGKDMGYLGQFKKIDHEVIENFHALKSIVAISPISSNNQTYFNHPIHLATDIAAELKAEKLIFYLKDLTNIPCNYLLNEISHKTQNLKNLHNITKIYRQLIKNNQILNVPRTHFLNLTKDALLIELFSINGSGVLINTDAYEQIRKANTFDSVMIARLIQKNIHQQSLVYRTKGQIKQTIKEFFVIDLDGLVIGCAALKVFRTEKIAEIYALTIDKSYQKQNKAGQLIQFVENIAKKNNLSQVFVRTTRAKQWFMNKAYKQVCLTDLPPLVQKDYNFSRNSLILLKTLDINN